MKTASMLVSTLACANTALAAPAQETYYKLVASAPGKTIHNKRLKPNAELWYIGKKADSNCGDVAPAVTVTASGYLDFYANGRQNQQYCTSQCLIAAELHGLITLLAYVDVSGAGKGLFGFTLPNKPAAQWDEVNVFTLIGSEQNHLKLVYDKDGFNWLACPSDIGDMYTIYPKKAYDRHVPISECISFQIRAEKVKTPRKVCVYH